LRDSRGPAIAVARLVLLENPLQGVVEIDSPLVGEGDQHEEDVADLERQILLGLVGPFELGTEAVIELARELTNLLDQASEVDERRPVALLESRDPGVDPGLGFLQVHLPQECNWNLRGFLLEVIELVPGD